MMRKNHKIQWKNKQKKKQKRNSNAFLWLHLFYNNTFTFAHAHFLFEEWKIYTYKISSAHICNRNATKQHLDLACAHSENNMKLISQEIF